MTEIIKAEDNSVLNRCIAVRTKVFVEGQGVSPEIENDEADVISERCDHFLICVDGIDVGAFRGYHIADGMIKLQRFCVLEGYRGTGIGSAAIRFAESYYRKRGIEKIILDGQLTAAEFYESHGYGIVSDIFEEAGIAHVKMEKMI